MRLNRIWKIGVTESMDLEDQKLVIFSNGIYVITGSLLLMAELVMGGISTVLRNPSLQTFTPFMMIGVAVFCLVLNKFHFFLISRILFLLSWTFIISVLSTITRGPTPNSYFFHPVYIILFSPIIHLLFSRPRDRYVLLCFLLMSVASVFFSVDFLMAFDHSANPGPLNVRSLNNFRIIFTTLWLILNLLMAYVLKTNWDFILEMRQQKEVIALQRKQLQVQNEELSSANDKLTFLNEQVHLLNEVLEKRVEERTQELTDRNKILSDYAFMNAHLLRTPVSRIKGLINLFQISEDPQEKKIIEESLLNSAEELDQVVHSISKKLNEGK
jgi:signal transduction histidine kinase